MKKGKVILIGILFIGVVIILTIFGLSIYNIMETKNIRRLLEKDSSKDESVLFYIYDSSKSEVTRNHQSLELNNAIIKMFSINMKEMINIDIDLGYDLLMKYIEKYNNDKNIIILSNLTSQDIIDIITYIDGHEKWDDIFYIAPTSTADNSYLNSNNVMRIYQKDDINTAGVFFSRIYNIDADHIILMVDEENTWARGLADLIEELNPITRINFNDKNIVLPNGSLNIILLSTNIFPRVFDILKDADIRSLTLGDGSYTSIPTTQRELDYLIDWNTNVIVMEQGLNDLTLANEVRHVISNKTMDLSSVTSMTNTIQLLSYLQNSVIDKDKFKNQFHFGGIRFDENLDGKARVFYGCRYTKVGANAEEVDSVFPVII